MRYRNVIYAGTVLTGLTGLIYQVVWQKYLSFIVGSETRSVSLVVAVFLGGLAAGYRYWGGLSERVTSRRKLLRIYGYIELGIGAYAALFPLYVELVTLISHHGPSWLLTDLLLTVLTVLLPTFLMGATIPLLVSVVPETAAEVHLCHAKIYGVNTLGACLGAFGASFFLIPRFGLHGSLLLASAVNLLVGTVFVLNRLRHTVAKDEPVEAIPHRFPVPAVYLYTLVTGLVTLSLEVLFVRVLGLTVGTGPHNFAMVVGVFILGLAIGSLMLTGRMLSVRVLFRAITLLVLYLVVLFHSVPYWPFWLNRARVALRSSPDNYTVYLLMVTGFLAVALLPFLVPLGMMLPLVYALLPKSSTDYGKKCGWIYFYNTLGTALGAILLSYLLLRFLDLDQVFKLDVLLLAVLALYLLYREKRWKLATVVGLVALAFLAGPRWDRASHYVGLFRGPAVDPLDSQGGWLRKPNLAPEVLFFADGPDSTVTVVQYTHGQQVVTAPDGQPRYEPLTSRSLVINGKADGDTLSDYSTITLAAILPYLYAPDRADLQAVVVGLGTGTTAGILGRAEDVERVTVVEIASTLVDAVEEFDEADYGLSTNPKVEIVDVDGFKYFSRLDERVDLIVSASSPPWVVGVENLFTSEFYTLAHDALEDDGVFLQWFPMFAMDDVLFRTILSNLAEVFPYRRLYRISFAEMGILAAKAPVLDDLEPRRFFEPTIARVRAKMVLDDVDKLELIRLFETAELEQLVHLGESKTHTLTRPGLAYASDRLRFIDPGIDWDRFVDPRLIRMTRTTDRRRDAFASMIARHPGGSPCVLPTLGPQLVCGRFNALAGAYAIWSRGLEQAPLPQLLQAYDMLRQEGVVLEDPAFLARAIQHAAERSAREAILDLYAKDALWAEAQRDLAALRDRGSITPDAYEGLLVRVASARRDHDRFVQTIRGG